MARFMFFIDGFNLFHSLDNTDLYANKTFFRKYKWLNLKALCHSLLKKDQQINRIKYYTTIATWKSQESQAKHRNYIKALESTGLIDVSYGLFRNKTKKCYHYNEIYCSLCNCKGNIPNIQEKRIDVQIAVDIIENATLNKYDTAIILSGDSDYIPAIKYIKRYCPKKQIGVAIPPGRKAQELKENADFSMNIKEHHLKTCQFNNTVQLQDGTAISSPI
jgi:uncharacterized LabA/DUF88 family protein